MAQTAGRASRRPARGVLAQRQTCRRLSIPTPECRVAIGNMSAKKHVVVEASREQEHFVNHTPAPREKMKRKEYEEFKRAVPEFELMLVNSGIRLFKYWFSVARATQDKRFHSQSSFLFYKYSISTGTLLSPEPRASVGYI